ncbi:MULTISPECIES: ABC transporter permease/substrate-binding protein [Exiguobacterium]|uniref:ABC transporter permease/substrate-binding protein n=1 Tax=Exiguobacterium TaxID=33986 RepID=UPI001BEADBD2|nr:MULTISPECIES: ABC transporter permease/substrate-binding protein [Exiguobacterium]MCT4775922.1 ABC transporter permease/substrate-binding protein [Exiguobacterium aquaticum]MCT4788355.1 ABC transporter permease/substrate-binding protein [Exiguobacterium mexicanum]
MLETFQNRRGELVEALIEHLQLSVVSLLIAVLIAVPLGIWLTRRKKVAETAIGVTAIIQTIPSLALLGLMIPLVGIGALPATIALVLYALLPILRNTFTGLNEVDKSLIEAARACGMKPNQSLMKVELPLALPVIMAGIRTAMVLIVGTATLAALVGAGGLGTLILLGINRNDNYLILLGAIPAAILALLFDFLLRQMEGATATRNKTKLITVSTVLALIIAAPLAFGRTQQTDLVIAGKLGPEPEILMNMYKLLIEDQTDLSVSVRPNFGETTFVWGALQSGDVDIYPEFTGTVLASLVKETPNSNDAREVYEQARDALADDGYALLEPMQFNNTYAIAIPRDYAEQEDITAISDLRNVQSDIKAGFTLEFTDREDGYPGLQQAYGLDFPSVVSMEQKLRYRAIARGDVNLVDAYATDPDIAENELIVLEDDQQFFPPYQGAPLVKQETLDEHPEIEDALNQLGGQITDEEMSELNRRVAYGNERAYDVAKDFLEQAGLL